MPKFLLQTHKFSGYYSNPYKPNGKGLKFTKWTTIRATDDQRQAELLWEEFQSRRNEGQLEHYRVTFGGKTVVDDRGHVYEKYTTPGDEKDTWMKFTGKILTGGVTL